MASGSLGQTGQEGEAGELPSPWEKQEFMNLYQGMDDEPVYGSGLAQSAGGLDKTVSRSIFQPQQL